jgi:hypothetical protein
MEFSDMMAGYLTMLSNSPEANTNSNGAAGAESDSDAATMAIMDVLQGEPDRAIRIASLALTTAPFLPALTASPEFRMAHEFGAEFLTSPHEESPFLDDILTTPALGSDMAVSPDIFTSPIMDFGDHAGYADAPLFADTSAMYDDAYAKSSQPAVTTAPAAASAPLHELHGLYTMPSPTTPALDSYNTSPAFRDIDAFPATPSMPATPALVASTSAFPQQPYARPQKPLPTGTRKNTTPATLIPLDAPIQARTYLTPSATSRRDLTVSRKRARADDDHDDLDAVDDVADDDERNAIEAKRRQNTLAARRSRRRKAEYQQALELTVEHWKGRALMLEGILQQHGVPVPPQSPPPL